MPGNGSQPGAFAYANDLADHDHLVAILASENRSEGRRRPRELAAAATRTTWCRYALDWDHIKAKWHLTATPPEWTALQRMVALC